VKPTIHLIPVLRTRGVVFPFPLYACVTWRLGLRTASPVKFLLIFVDHQQGVRSVHVIFDFRCEVSCLTFSVPGKLL
jgi:hypothetical protein